MNDRFLILFFEEAQELLQALEAGLMDMEAKRDDRDHLDRTFRAAHTLKGAAGMVGLRPIADFTHKVEAVLDDIRGGRMAVSADAITILLQAKDHLASALDEASEGRTLANPTDLEEALVGLKEGGPITRAEAPTPVPFVEVLDAEIGSIRRYRIHIRPHRDLLRKGIDPIGFLEELRGLGEARVEVDDRDFPTLDAIEPTDSLLSWTVDLATKAERSTIEEVFLFLDDPSQATIEDVTKESPPAYAPNVEPRPVSTPESPRARVAVAAPRVRVDAEQLDALVGMAGELAVLTDSLSGLAELVGSGPMAGTIEALERLGRRLRDATLELRMVPVEELFVRFPRVVRDLAETTGKRIDFRMEGQETLLDRTIVERLADPMIHLIRNAIDHGLETPKSAGRRGRLPRVGSRSAPGTKAIGWRFASPTTVGGWTAPRS